MSATNSTTNYNLPVFLGTDKPAWLTDWNGAMNTIDTAIAGVSNSQQGDATAISGLQSSVSSLSDTVSGHTTAITSLNSAVSGNTGSINTINSLIGNGEPTTTDKTIIGAINELNADIQEIVPTGELTASNVSIVPITGVTADDVQEALEGLKGLIDNVQPSQPEAQVIAEVTGNDSKTLAQLLNELYSAIDRTTYSDGNLEDSKLLFEGFVCSVAEVGENELRYSLTNASSTAFSLDEYIMSANASAAYRCSITSSASITSIGSTVPHTGVKYQIVI